MSIAIHSSKSASRAAEASAVSRRRESAPDAAAGERSSETKAPKGRHALMNALADALSTLGSGPAATNGETGAADEGAAPPIATREQKEALQAFTHELLDALRPTPDATVKGHQGRGFAWGRTSLGDLAQRLEALAQKLVGAATAPVDTPAPAVPATGGAATGAAPSGTGTAAGADATAETAAATGVDATTDAEAPPLATEPSEPVVSTATTPAPVATSGSVATPTESPLLAAFRQLATALKGTGASAEASPADALAALLHRMSQALVSDGRGDTPASGSLVDVSV